MNPLFPCHRLLTSACVLIIAGCGGGGGGGSTSNPTPTPPPTPSNSAPSFTSAASAAVEENINGVVYTATASDADGDTLVFSLTGGADQSGFSIDSASGAVSLIAAADFESPADANTDNTYELTLGVDDGNGGSATLDVSINVTDVDETVNVAPNFTSGTTASVNENTTGVVYTATAVDGNADALTFSITGGPDQTAFSIDGASGAVTLLAAADFENPTDANADNTYELTLNVDDGNGGTDSLSVSVAVNDLVENMNVAPSFTSASMVSIAENINGVIYMATADDANGDMLMFSIAGGADQGAFNLDNASGALSLIAAADFENPADANADNTYELMLGVNDGNGGSAMLVLAINVTDVDENTSVPPNFTSAATASVDENTGGVVYTATAVDGNDDPLTFSITGGADETAFSIDGSSGELTLLAQADFENPVDANADNTYELTLGVDDGDEGTDSLALSISIADVAQLSFQVSYPSPNANLGGDVTETSVTGTVEDLEDGEVLTDDVDVSVNNVQGTLEPGATASDPTRWRAQVPVADPLNIELTDRSGNTQSVSQSLGNQGFLAKPHGVALDAANNRAILVDSQLPAVLTVDLTSGLFTTLTNPSDFALPNGLALDAANNRVLVTETAIGLVTVDLATGVRTVVSSASTNVGTGPNLPNPIGVALDAANDRAIVVNDVPAQVFSIDLATGNRTILSSDSVGAGPLLERPGNITLDLANDQSFITDTIANAVFSLDLTTGDRAIVSNATTGAGTPFSSPRGLVLDAANNRVLVTDSTLGEVLAVDLQTGDRSALPSDTTGSGINLGSPVDVAFDGNRALIVDTQLRSLVALDAGNGDRSEFSPGVGDGPEWSSSISNIAQDGDTVFIVDGDFSREKIVQVDVNTGNRAIVSDADTGVGTNFGFPTGIVVDSQANRLLVANDSFNAVVAVDRATGDRTIFSDNTDGPNMVTPEGMALDRDNNRLLLVDRFADTVFAMDLDTGERTIISNVDVGLGAIFETPQDITLDSTNNRAFVSDSTGDAVYAVDLETGDRTVLSSDATGLGASLDFPLGLTLDTDNNRVLVVSASSGALVAVDLTSGDRTVLSDQNTGSGPLMSFPRDVLLDAANNRALVSDASIPALLVIDLATGERAINSN